MILFVDRMLMMLVSIKFNWMIFKSRIISWVTTQLNLCASFKDKLFINSNLPIWSSPHWSLLSHHPKTTTNVNLLSKWCYSLCTTGICSTYVIFQFSHLAGVNITPHCPHDLLFVQSKQATLTSIKVWKRSLRVKHHLKKNFCRWNMLRYVL